MELPTTVAGVIEEMRTIGAGLEPTDGVSVFNTVYLSVTERIGRLLDEGRTFDDGPAMVDLDTHFAGLWLTAYRAADSGPSLSKAWAPLFAGRHRHGLLPIQFALAGMNTHIEHDLALAVVRTCEARGSTPDDPAVLADFYRVNEVLAEGEAEIRRSFLDEVGHALDDELRSGGPPGQLVEHREGAGRGAAPRAHDLGAAPYAVPARRLPHRPRPHRRHGLATAAHARRPLTITIRGRRT